MSETEFLAQTLSSRELLALLFVCEARRKGHPLSATDVKAMPKGWESYLDTFADRLGALGESTRFEVLEAHLMSVEDIDIYNDESLKVLLEESRPVWEELRRKLEQDPRFAPESANGG